MVNHTVQGPRTSCDQIVERMENQKEHIIVYFGSGNTYLREEWAKGRRDDTTETGWLQNYDINCAQKFNSSYETAVMIRPSRYGDRERVLTHDKRFNLLQWVQKNMNTDLFSLTKENSDPILKHNMNTIVLLTNPGTEDKAYYKAFENVSGQVGNVLFAVSDGSNDLNGWALRMLNNRTVEYPYLFAFSPSNQFDIIHNT